MNKMNYRLSVSSFCVFVVLVVSCTAPVVEGQTSLRDIAEAIDRRVTRVLGSLDQSLGNLFADMRNFTRAVDNVASCYSAQLKGRRMDIFNNSAPFKSVATDYYVSVPCVMCSMIDICIYIPSRMHFQTNRFPSVGFAICWTLPETSSPGV